MSLDKKLTDLNKKLERSTVARENELARRYVGALKEIRRILGDNYSKYEEKGVLNYEVMAKYERIKKVEDDFRRQIMLLDKDVKSKIFNHLKDQYQEGYYRTAFLIETESKAALAYSAVKANVIEKAINNNFTGLTLNDRLERRRNDLIIHMREELTKGLHEGRTFKQMSDGIKGVLENDVVKANRIIRTESKKIRSQAGLESAKHADARGVKMAKVWNTVQDERVRDRHDGLKGTEIDVDIDFEINGDKASAPGLFNDPANSINCRCFITYEIKSIEKPPHEELANMDYDEWIKERLGS